MTGTKNSNGTSRVLDDIPVNVELSIVLKRLRLPKESQRIREIIEELITLVKSVARPKALYRVSQAGTSTRKTISIDGMEFTSHVPTLSFHEGETVFPYVSTCGQEIDALKVPADDFMKYYCLNIIKEIILRESSEYLHNHLVEEYGLSQITRVGPGEALGPLTQQRKLFSILGDVEESIGVRLSDHNMMVPEKSSSGIYFETDIKLESCQLCPDSKCKGRRAPYQPAVLKKYRRPSDHSDSVDS